MSIALRTVRAVCPHDCPDTCGMVVTVDPATNVAVKLKGDPDHPFTAGYLCAKVNHYLNRATKKLGSATTREALVRFDELAQASEDDGADDTTPDKS